MNLWEKILIVLDSKMVTPKMYGWFHISFLIITIFIIIFLALKYKHPTEKQTKNILLIFSLLCIVLEIYKQINYSFNYNNSKIWWEYQWYAFPFQFCSTPMYVALLAVIIPNPKIKKYLYAFLATYGLIGGLAVMIYPNTVFISTIGISVQTMIHHGTMIILGMFILISKQIEFNFKTIINALCIFMCLIFIAEAINISTFYLHIHNGLEMFYISPFHTCTLPIFSKINSMLPYPIFLLLYIIIFTIGASFPIIIARKIKNS